MFEPAIYYSLEESLKKLRTSYVDILYVDFWEWSTPVEEVVLGSTSCQTFSADDSSFS